MEHRGHRLREHTADIALELWAPTEKALLDEGARAIVALLTDDAPGPDVAATEHLQVHLDTLDPEDRLVQWLNEILYLAVTRGLLYRRGRLSLGRGRLDAEVEAERAGAGRLRAELKAVTYHGLRLRSGPDGWRAVVIIDV